MAAADNYPHRGLAAPTAHEEPQAGAKRQLIDRPEALLDRLRFEMGMLRVESFRVLFLDIANRLIRDETLWRGTVDTVQVHPREIIRQALFEDASALILVHNHPSGDVAPSPSDKALTRQIGAAAQLMNITLHDHIIVGHKMCNSLRCSEPHLFVFGQDTPGDGI